MNLKLPLCKFGIVSDGKSFKTDLPFFNET